MGRRVTQTTKKTRVREASRILSAISLGVLRRLAPSTRDIMRSRKVSPVLEATRTISQSDSRRVPPVTALRSPPASRMTGALSPVMADSSTEAMPSTMSPSDGMGSPASTRNRSPRARALAGTWATAASRRGAASFLATTSRRRPLRAAAWALPRPSAMASAKLAKRMVAHSQTATAATNPAGASPCPRAAWTARTVVRMLPM